MSIEYRIGDLFAQPDLDALAHGVNCMGVIGGGISGEFIRRWPKDRDDYRSVCDMDVMHLGRVLWYGGGEAVFRVYLATQRRPGPDARLYAIHTAMANMVIEASHAKVERIGLPRIGCGIGGLDWESQVRPLLEEIAATTDVKLVVVTPPGEAGA